MSLTSSLYAGISGLSTQSQAMSVIGNNLANTNTIGFKGSTMQFEDVFYSAVNTSSGFGQVGHGTSVASIYGNFSQGSYESSSEATDVAIGGNGFFVVADPSQSGETYYTRAGNFRFDSNGYLVDPNGYRVQGWEVLQSSSGTGNVKTIGTPDDIRLNNFQSPPQATSAVSLSMNLDLGSTDNSTDAANPFFALLNQWDGTDDEAIGDSDYAYQNTIKVYDENGTAHDLTIYFDPVDDDSVTSQAGGNQLWEYIVTCAPDEDGRTIGGTNLKSTSAAGLLMAGTLTFNSGEMIGMSAFTLGSGATGDFKNLTNWIPADVDDEGYPVFTANFSGMSNASTTSATEAQPISLDLGVRTTASGTVWSPTTVSNASMIGTTPTVLPRMVSPEYSASATTNYDNGSTTLSQSQDGYAAGFLQDITVNTDGVVTGKYSNGQVLDLYMLTLANFSNEQGLSRMGNNLFEATRESGAATTGTANTGTLGSVNSNTLEQSNVDMASEMVRLITTQRGFQANSKVITTADSMLSDVIQLKR